jgi:hypothetical protein
MITKRAQEEMVGFVLIILLVAVIFLIFLGLFLRRSSTDNRIESSEISQFLDAMTEVTSNCSLNSGYSFESIGDLATECERNSLCSGGKTACEILKTSTKEIIESSWNFGAESPNKGYKFLISFNSSLAQPIIWNSVAGSCGSYREGSRSFQKATFDLKICLN